MGSARAAQFIQPNRNAAEKVLNCEGCGEKQAVEQSPSSLDGFCIAGVKLPEIVEKRQARGRIYIFAEQVTARGIRMAA